MIEMKFEFVVDLFRVCVHSATVVNKFQSFDSSDRFFGGGGVLQCVFVMCEGCIPSPILLPLPLLPPCDDSAISRSPRSELPVRIYPEWESVSRRVTGVSAQSTSSGYRTHDSFQGQELVPAAEIGLGRVPLPLRTSTVTEWAGEWMLSILNMSAVKLHASTP